MVRPLKMCDFLLMKGVYVIRGHFSYLGDTNIKHFPFEMFFLNRQYFLKYECRDLEALEVLRLCIFFTKFYFSISNF